MQVNFGRTIVFNENGYRTSRSQEKVDNFVEDILGIPKDPWSDKITENTAVEKLLSDRKNCDVFIKNKKNGNVEVEVKKLWDYSDSSFEDESINTNSGFVPYDLSGKKKLSIELDLSKPDSIVKNVKAFANKCKNFALKPDTDKNSRLEYNYVVKKM